MIDLIDWKGLMLILFNMSQVTVDCNGLLCWMLWFRSWCEWLRRTFLACVVTDLLYIDAPWLMWYTLCILRCWRCRTWWVSTPYVPSPDAGSSVTSIHFLKMSILVLFSRQCYRNSASETGVAIWIGPGGPGRSVHKLMMWFARLLTGLHCIAG